MPRVKAQHMFPMEQCAECDTDGVLYQTLRGRYFWSCPMCLKGWRKPGSQLDLVNALAGPIDYDTNAGIIVEEHLKDERL